MESTGGNNDNQKKPSRVPTAIVKHLEHDSIGVRFESIGDRNRFRILLQHFRFEFVLAQCGEIDNLKWWMLNESQLDLFSDFCRRHGIYLTSLP